MALMPLGNYSGKGKMDGVFFPAWIIGSFCSVLASCMVWYTLWHDLFERYWFCLLSIDQNPFGALEYGVFACCCCSPALLLSA